MSWPVSSPRSPWFDPPGRVADVTPKSVKKKFKDKAFARAVNREDIRQGIEELGVDMDEHIQRVVGMR